MPCPSIFLSSALGSASPCGAKATPELDFESLHTPGYENGFVLDWNYSTQKASLYASAEKPTYSVPSARPRSRSYDARAVDLDGTVARSYYEKSLGRIEIFSDSGVVTGTIDIGLYEPEPFAFGLDHTLGL